MSRQDCLDRIVPRSDVVRDLEGCRRGIAPAGWPQRPSRSVAVIDGRWRFVVIGRRRSVIDRRRWCRVIAFRGDRGCRSPSTRIPKLSGHGTISPAVRVAGTPVTRPSPPVTSGLEPPREDRQKGAGPPPRRSRRTRRGRSAVPAIVPSASRPVLARRRPPACRHPLTLQETGSPQPGRRLPRVTGQSSTADRLGLLLS